MALLNGDPESIGGYRLLDRLGAGGMGTVFLAQAESGRLVAVKVVHQQFAEDFEFRTRFRQEVAAARQVSGAFTAPVVDADADAPRPWMATSYVPATTLGARVRREGALTEPGELRLLAVGLVEALRELHRAGVIHRDLKPDNVLLTDDGPRVIDFGISRCADHQTLTVTGRVLGTPPYMSPEQLIAPHRVTPASDVFSLGAVLVYATTGRGPFDAESPYLTAYNVVHEPPAVAALSGTVREIIQWCLAKEPSERPGTDALLAAFRAAPEAEWGTRPAAGPVRDDGSGSAAPRVWWRRRSIALLTVAATVAATAGGTWGMGLWEDEGTPPRSPSSRSAGPGSAPSPTAAPLVEKTAALQPDGWALWQTKLTGKDENLRYCNPSPRALVCASSSSTGKLAAFDPRTGKQLWRRPVSYTEGSSAPAQVELLGVSGSGRTAYYTEATGQGVGRLRAVDTVTGRALWSTPSGSHHPYQQAAYLGSVIVTSDLNELHAWDAASGRRLWDAEAGGFLHVTRNQLYLEEQSVFTGKTELYRIALENGKKTLFGEFGAARLVAFAKNVVLLRETDGTLTLGSPNGSRRATKLPDISYTESDGIVYGRDIEGTIIAADTQTGQRRWTTKTNLTTDEMDGKVAPVIADGRIYLSSSDGRIACLSAKNGALLWRSAPRKQYNELGNVAVSVRDQTIYAVHSRLVYALRPPA
ncbi:PQQ-binding-like beta-propeller repeat protein [Streptomyces polyrhachis]|uniref:PQQ-binding-like beta-propeller repeat protein n=1 Tax=Streptomyces polyrhachis TaxID=1282885 RepID=A0ABW2G8H0_9ACTN